MADRVLIIGGGLAGLCCAQRLQQAGVPFLILEASDGPGGRIRTDVIDGFRLDRGFQVFLSSYPEASATLDYDTLQLRPFLPGALVRFRGRFHEMADPWRRPLAALMSLSSPIGSLTDKLRVARLRRRSLSGTIEDRFHDPEMTTLEALHEVGFSSAMIDRFFRPFLGGVFLDRDLQTSRRMLSFVFRMFSLGLGCLPSQGMEAIPRQLAARLPRVSIRLGADVRSVRPGTVTLAGGEGLRGKAVVVATDGPSAMRLLGESPARETVSGEGRGVTCLYFAAAKAPTSEPLLVLNGDGEGPINNLCVPTAVAPSYGPGDRSLVSVTVLGAVTDSRQLLGSVREQLVDWFGRDSHEWRHLRTYSIPYALPDQQAPALSVAHRPVRWRPGLYVCGDHRETASIQGAMVSGRRVAEALLEDFA